MRVAIVGSRDYPNRDQVEAFVSTLPPDTTVISGGARGVDQWAEYAAKRRRLPFEVYPADWDQYGKRAGFMRNTTIVEQADCVVVFWDGKSHGTLDTVQKAVAAGKLSRVITPPTYLAAAPEGGEL